MRAIKWAPAIAFATVPMLFGGTIGYISSSFVIDAKGHLVTMKPDLGGAPDAGISNIVLTGAFDTAVVGVPFVTTVDKFHFSGGPETFNFGTYTLDLVPKALSSPTATTTLLSNGGFSSFFDIFVDVTFNNVGAGSIGNNGGDVPGEFGSGGAFGGADCVSNTCSTELSLTFVNGGTTGGGDSGGGDNGNVPEPSTVLLMGSAVIAITVSALRRRKA